MFYNVLKAKDLVKLDHEEKYDKMVLLENNNSALVAVALKKDEILDTHTAMENAAVMVLDGEIEIHFNAEKFKLDKGEILMFKKDSEHKVIALKDSKFLVIKV
ncbi:cupin domain-containing protein [bacterium]|nr:cupin domain-containing protein [bacterium]